jgi:hypothetical protein
MFAKRTPKGRPAAVSVHHPEAMGEHGMRGLEGARSGPDGTYVVYTPAEEG